MGLSVKGILDFLIPPRSALQFYDTVLLNEMAIKHNSAAGGRNATRSLGINEFTTDICGAYNKDLVYYYYLITDYPKQLPIGWIDQLRLRCRSGVSLSLLTSFTPDKIDWDSHKMKTKMAVLNSLNNDLREEVNGLSSFKRVNYAEKIQQQKYLEESVSYLTDATKKRDRGFSKVSLLLILSGVRGENFDKSVQDIEHHLGNNAYGFSFQRVMYNIPAVLSVFSPFSNRKNDSETLKCISTHTFSDEIFSCMNSYQQGMVGTYGIYLGSDKYSQFPVFSLFKKRMTDAANVLVTAETGGGKSNLMKNILIQLLALGHYGTIMDIEGTEYRPLYQFLHHDTRCKIIDMGSGTGRYFDPVEIPEKSGDPDTDAAALNMSKNYTELMLCILAGDLMKEDSMYSTFIKEAISLTYSRHNVSVIDSDTWANSKGLTLFDVYETMKTLDDYYKQIDAKNYEHFAHLLFKLKLTMGTYFDRVANGADKDGPNSHMFRDRIFLSDVADAQLVICSFGLAGKSADTISPEQEALMLLSAAMFSYHRSITSFQKGILNFKVWEEFQRWGSFEGSENTIKVALTGGRKLGDTNFIITNDVQNLLDNDRFGILGNLQVHFIGKIKNKKTRLELLEILDLLDFKNELEYLSIVPEPVPSVTDFVHEYNTKIKNDSVESMKGYMPKRSSGDFVATDDWKWSFLFTDATSKTVLKVRIPPSLAESALFKTAPAGVVSVDTLTASPEQNQASDLASTISTDNTFTFAVTEDVSVLSQSSDSAAFVFDTSDISVPSVSEVAETSAFESDVVSSVSEGTLGSVVNDNNADDILGSVGSFSGNTDTEFTFEDFSDFSSNYADIPAVVPNNSDDSDPLNFDFNSNS